MNSCVCKFEESLLYPVFFIGQLNRKRI